jgi:hypothetical protein
MSIFGGSQSCTCALKPPGTDTSSRLAERSTPPWSNCLTSLFDSSTINCTWPYKHTFLEASIPQFYIRFLVLEWKQCTTNMNKCYINSFLVTWPSTVSCTDMDFSSSFDITSRIHPSKHAVTIFKNSAPNWKKSHGISITKTDVYSCLLFVNTLRWQNAEFINVKADETYSYCSILKHDERMNQSGIG